MELLTIDEWLEQGSQTAEEYGHLLEHFSFEFEAGLENFRNEGKQTAEHFEQWVSADINNVLMCAQKIMKNYPSFYVLRTLEDVEPELHGPFYEEKDQVNCLEKLKEGNENKDLPDGIYTAKIDDGKLVMK